MPFDLSTTLVLSCAVTALQSVIMLVLWSRRRDAYWLLWTAAIFVLGGGFLFLVVIDDPGLRQISIGLGTATFIAATFAVWSSARVFVGKPVVWPALIAAIGAWAGISIFTDTLDSLLPGVIVKSIAAIAWIGGGAWEHWQAERSGTRRGQWGVIVLFAAVALLFAIRLPFVGLWPYPFGGQPGNSQWLTVFTLSLDAAAVCLTVLTVLRVRALR